MYYILLFTSGHFQSTELRFLKKTKLFLQEQQYHLCLALASLANRYLRMDISVH